MRKMSKGLAITAGIFMILSVISTVITTVQSTRGVPTSALVSILLPNLLSVLCLILLTVVLFRGKVDTFSGIIFFVNAAVRAFLFVGNIISITGILHAGIPVLPYILNMVNNLIALVLFILMGVHSLRKNAGKTPLFGLGFILTAILLSVQTIAGYISSMASSLDSSFLLIVLIPAIIGGIIVAIPTVLMGFAVGSAKAAAPLDPNDPYGLYARYGMTPPAAQVPQYQAPQYQAPQYQAPQQNAWQPPQAPQQDTWQPPQAPQQ